MPHIQLTVPVGTLSADGRTTIQGDLARALMRWEGAPDTELFRSLSWSSLHELPSGALVTAQDSDARLRIDITVPAGALDDKRRAGLVEETTRLVLAAAGLGADHSMRVWVLVHEQADGTWGVGGQIFRYADLVALAEV